MSDKIVIGIDPGPAESALVAWDGGKVLSAEDMNNVDLLEYLRTCPHIVAIERIRGFGLKIGNDVLDTCEWIGRFHMAKGRNCYLVDRKAAVTHLCGTAKGSDVEVRQALIYRIGEHGTKKQPGPLYGVTGHRLPALAIAITYADLMGSKDGQEIASKTPVIIKRTPVAA